MYEGIGSSTALPSGRMLSHETRRIESASFQLLSGFSCTHSLIWAAKTALLAHILAGRLSGYAPYHNRSAKNVYYLTNFQIRLRDDAER